MYLTCEECNDNFEVREDIAVDMIAWADQPQETRIPIVCSVCHPNHPHDSDLEVWSPEYPIQTFAEYIRVLMQKVIGLNGR